ncbi:MAG: hypothetical protein V3V61_05455 [Gammaproteobacteria bacterium]
MNETDEIKYSYSPETDPPEFESAMGDASVDRDEDRDDKHENRARKDLNGDIDVEPPYVEDKARRDISSSIDIRPKSTTASQYFALVEKYNIKSVRDLVREYNRSTGPEKKILYEGINHIIEVFKKQSVLTIDLVRDFIELADCQNDDIRLTCLYFLSDNFSGSDKLDTHLGYGLSYFLRRLSFSKDPQTKKFIRSKQNTLIAILDALFKGFEDKSFHSSREHNHEVDVLFDAVMSASQILFKSGLQKLTKSIKDRFYKNSKSSYWAQYKKVARGTKSTSQVNYHLKFKSDYAIQHLVRIKSDQGKITTTARRSGRFVTGSTRLFFDLAEKLKNVLTLSDVPGPDDFADIIKASFDDFVKVFGFKDLQYVWYDVLEWLEGEITTPALSDDLTTGRLGNIHNIIKGILTKADLSSYAHIDEFRDLDEKSIQGESSAAFNFKKDHIIYGYVLQLCNIALSCSNEDICKSAIDKLHEIHVYDRGVWGSHEPSRHMILDTLKILSERDNSNVSRHAGDGLANLHRLSGVGIMRKQGALRTHEPLAQTSETYQNLNLYSPNHVLLKRSHDSLREEAVNPLIELSLMSRQL